ncbi:MAG: RloB domain-containing protein [Anaerolineae bacterium]|nr:RloB domain-containing protein [Anaerolineae bacterium]
MNLTDLPHTNHRHSRWLSHDCPSLLPAYSNQSFAIWYLLHFRFQQTALSRRDYIKLLGNLLGHHYKKNSETIYDELLSRRSNALCHAQRLLEEYQPLIPADNDPSTTVHHLVEQLIHFGGPITRSKE